MNLWARLSAIVCLLLMAAGARAQEGFNVDSFEPATDQRGSLLNIYGARTLTPGTFGADLMFSYGRAPLSIEDAETGTDLGDLVGSIGTLSLLTSLGISEHFDMGVAFPLHRVSAGSEFAGEPPQDVQDAVVESNAVAFGDIRLVPRLSLLARRGDRGWGLAFLVPVSLPTGDAANYAGEALRVEPRVAVDYAGRGWSVVANLGYLFRARTELLDSVVDDALRWGLGGEVALVPSLSLLAELFGHFNVMTEDFTSNDAPVEAMTALRWRTGRWLAQLGGGVRLVRGVPAPDWRIVPSVGYAMEAPAAVSSEETAAPDPDSDRDGILDSQDRCPNEPEDKEGFQDEDGCPEPDRDADGISNGVDRCPNEAEDRDTFQDDDGCPEADNDGDGLLDAQDRCPNEAEDKDGFQDEDGCGDPDNDADSVMDAEDRCPNESGLAADGGCPKAQVTAEKIEISEAFYFALNSAQLEARSLPLLDTIAGVLRDHPEIELVVVEGHTDSQGNAARNVKLSQQRAQTIVQGLIGRGVAGSRLRAEGFGANKPIASNADEAGRTKNRRVELRIERRAAQ